MQNYYEAEVCPGGGMELEYKLTEDEWFLDPRYEVLNLNEISQLLHRFDHDAYLRTVTHIYQSTLFSGGVLFCRDDAEMEPDAVRWFDATWSAFGMSLDRQLSSLGFAATTSRPHYHYLRMPITIDITQCTVLYRLDIITGPHFVFFENVCTPMQNSIFLAQRGQGKQSGRTVGCMAGMYKYIPGVVVYNETEPTANGKIRSKVAVLAPDLDLDDTLYTCTKQATLMRANPPLVLETVKEAHDPQSMVSTISPLSMMLGNGEGPSGMSKRDVGAAVAEEQRELKAYAYSNYISKFGPDGMNMANRLATSHIAALSASSGPKEHYLGEGFKVASQTMAESPGDLLINFRTARMERVFNIFGIPLGMVSQTSSLGGKTGMNENVFVVFLNTQKQKKQQLLGFMYHMYEQIYQKHHGLQRIMASSSNYESNKDHYKTPTRINIIMTGLPEDLTLEMLYKMGCLKYEAFIKFTSGKHSIPIEDFNTKCDMTLLDLNGIKADKVQTSV